MGGCYVGFQNVRTLPVLALLYPRVHLSPRHHAVHGGARHPQMVSKTEVCCPCAFKVVSYQKRPPSAVIQALLIYPAATTARKMATNTGLLRDKASRSSLRTTKTHSGGSTLPRTGYLHSKLKSKELQTDSTRVSSYVDVLFQLATWRGENPCRLLLFSRCVVSLPPL